MKLLPVALVGALLIVFLLGTMFFGMIGFFPGMSSSPRYAQTGAYANEGSSDKLMMAGGSQSAAYWYYNPFSQGLNSMLFILLSVIAPIITIVRLKENNGWKTLAAAAIGTFFIAGALTVLTGALQNLFSFYPNSSTGVQVGDVYGWLFFMIIEAAIGAGLIYLAEKWRNEAGAPRPVYSVVAHSLGLFLSVYAAALFVSSAASAADLIKNSAYSQWSADIVLSPMKLFGWLILGAALFYGAYRLLLYSKKSEPESSMARFAFHTPVSFIGAIALGAGVANAAIFLSAAAGVSSDRNGFALLFAIIYNAAACLLAAWLVKQQETKGIQRTGHLWLACAGAIVALFALLYGVFALYSAISRNYGQSSWDNVVFAILMLAYGGALLYASQRLTAKKYAERSAQEGSIYDFFYGEEDAKKAGASEEQSEIAALRARVESLEARLAKLEAVKKKK